MSRIKHKLTKDQVFEVIDDFLTTYEGEDIEDNPTYEFFTEMLLKFSADELTSALEETVASWDLNYITSPNFSLDEDDPGYIAEIGDDYDYIERVTGVKAR